MYLKDAFRYQNCLAGLFNQAVGFLSNRENTTITTKEHLRKKVNPEAENETLVVERARGITDSNNDVVEFLAYLVDERAKLSAAISKAKAASGFDLDVELANNRNRQAAASCLESMARIQPEEKMTTGRDYKFNTDGEQVTYAYDVKQVTSIDFDRKAVRALAKKYRKTADEVSARVDRLLVDVKVDYEPLFSPSDGFQDAITTWKESRTDQ